MFTNARHRDREREKESLIKMICIELCGGVHTTVLRDRDRCKFPFGSVHILSVSVLVSVSVSGSVNEPVR